MFLFVGEWSGDAPLLGLAKGASALGCGTTIVDILSLLTFDFPEYYSFFLFFSSLLDITAPSQAIKIVDKTTRRRLGRSQLSNEQKIRREIAIMKKCIHPNVVRLIEVIDDPNARKIYMGRTTRNVFSSVFACGK